MESTSAWHVVLCDQPFQITSKNLSRLRMALCPTSVEGLEELFHQGYSDTLRFFRQTGELSCMTINYEVLLKFTGILVHMCYDIHEFIYWVL